MKKILTTMFAVLVVAAMGGMFSADAWADLASQVQNIGGITGVPAKLDGKNVTIKNAPTTTTTTSTTPKTETPANSQTRQTSGSSKAQNSGSSKAQGGSWNFNGAAIMNNLNNGKGSFLQNLAGGVLGSVSMGGSSNAGSYVNQGSSTGGVASVYSGGAGGMGVGGYIGMAGGTMASLGSAIWGTVTAKLLDLFGNVKMVLYILAAFGLVGFAFMALFGKVRWGWVCALAFGLAAVAAAGQIIDYVSGQALAALCMILQEQICIKALAVGFSAAGLYHRE